MRAGSAAFLLLLAAFGLIFASCPEVDLSKKGVRPPGEVSGTAVGPVAGFGGMLTAGAEFSDAPFALVEDDEGRGIDGIAEGMMAVVRGTLNASFRHGLAQTVTIERELLGPLADNVITINNGTIRMLGQTVIVNPATVFKGVFGDHIDLYDLYSFTDNGYLPIIEVHGSAQGAGVIRASYIGCVQDNVAYGGDVRLRGTARNVDSQERTFRIGTQMVSFRGLSSAGRVDWPPTGLSDGLVLDVRGYLQDDNGTWIVLTDRAADRVAVISVGLGNALDRIALEGYILSGSPGSFEMSAPGGTVNVSSDVSPSGDSFGLFKKVRVRGTLLENSGKRIRASSVFVLKALDVWLEGPPGGLPVSGNTITLLGRTVGPDDFTMYLDTTGAVREGFRLNSLSPGDIVRVTGWVDDAATWRIAAARLDRVFGAPDRVGLQGPVSSFTSHAPSSLSILGITVNTAPDAIDYYDRGGKALDNREAFYGVLAVLGPNAVVRVRNGIFVPGSSPRINPPTSGARMSLEIVNVNR